MNEKMSKRRIQIRDLQKQEIEEKQERRLLIRLHIFSHLRFKCLWKKRCENELSGRWIPDVNKITIENRNLDLQTHWISYQKVSSRKGREVLTLMKENEAERWSTRNQRVAQLGFSPMILRAVSFFNSNIPEVGTLGHILVSAEGFQMKELRRRPQDS